MATIRPHVYGHSDVVHHLLAPSKQVYQAQTDFLKHQPSPSLQTNLLKLQQVCQLAPTFSNHGKSTSLQKLSQSSSQVYLREPIFSNRSKSVSVRQRSQTTASPPAHKNFLKASASLSARARYSQAHSKNQVTTH
jgi:hypothetical protein